MFEDEIAKRVLELEMGKKIGPFQVQFNPTNKCNLKCKFCWLRDFDGDGLNYEELSTRKYKEIIGECGEMDVHTIEITGGGEPLLRKDILVLMKLIKKYGIFGRLITNGTLFTKGLIKKLIKISWDEIIFSLDAPNKNVNDYLRGKSFDRAVKTIKTLQIMKIHEDKEKPMVHVHMVLCNKNFNLLPKMFEFVHSLGCRNLMIEPIVLLAIKIGAGKDLLLNKHRRNLTSYLKRAKEVAHQYNFETNLDGLNSSLFENINRMENVIKNEGKKKGILSIPCYQPWYSMIIRPWGIVGPCCMFDGQENILEKDLKKIWFGKYFTRMRKMLVKNILPSFCSKCNPSQVIENRKIREKIEKHKKVLR